MKKLASFTLSLSNLQTPMQNYEAQNKMNWLLINLTLRTNNQSESLYMILHSLLFWLFFAYNEHRRGSSIDYNHINNGKRHNSIYMAD